MDIKKVKRILLALSDIKAAVCEQLLRNARSAVPRSFQGQMGSYQEGDLEREVSFSMAQLAQGQHRAIADALRRLEQGKYGLCERCDTLIREARLKAIPWANMCLWCQETTEKKVGSSSNELATA
ncbi:MAG: TraR/DksA C4-type zinc finger protein [Patescibacteria group bacterium]|mgnify:CR=1 FL=1